MAHYIDNLSFCSILDSADSLGAMECEREPTSLNTDDVNDNNNGISKLLSANYIHLLNNLPPTSYTIWDHILNDIQSHPSAKEPCHSIDEIENFASIYFSADVVTQIVNHLEWISDGSNLGVNYILDRRKADFVAMIINDCRSTNYSRQVGTDGWTVVGGKGKVKTEQQKHVTGAKDTRDGNERGESLQSGHGEKCGGGGDDGEGRGREDTGRGRGIRHGGRRGGRGGKRRRVGREPDEYPQGEPFRHITLEIVQLPPTNTTPTKGHPDRLHSIRSRASQFLADSKVGRLIQSPYDPAVAPIESDHTTWLFHGCRYASWPNFQKSGILPPLRPNEFSSGPAFYLTNSVIQAFEHPLHVHFKSSAEDTIVVMAFELDVAVLHGERQAPGLNRMFSVLWFEEADNDWQMFCQRNLYDKTMPHGHDIVIGPACIPGEDFIISLDGKIQIAFCSRESMDWVGGCVKLAFWENREARE
jgi:hypothetical protein